MPQISPMNWTLISLMLMSLIMLMKMNQNNMFISKIKKDSYKKSKKTFMKW